MKLLSRYYRVNIVATIIVVLLSSLCYYFVIHYVLVEQLDDALKVEEQEVIDYTKRNNKLPDPSSYRDQQVIFRPAANKVQRKFSTIYVPDAKEKENVETRQLIFPLEVNGSGYDCLILKSQEETEDLIQLILLITGLIIFLLLLTLFIVNRFVLNRLWRPFNSTIYQLKQFNLSAKTELHLEQSPISEFKDLNEAVLVMTRQVNHEYEALKTFTENASHEMQTPLAIINSKLDVLIQDEHINEKQMLQLQGIYQALDRLSKLNQSLLLLTRIGNRQFPAMENISLDEMIREKLFQSEEMIQNMSLHVDTQIAPTVTRGNKQLLDVLFGNLFNNAIRYNVQHGNIVIKLGDENFSITNTGALPALDEQKIFQRFYRHADTRPEGNGLGLSIVKQICDNYGYLLSYHHSGTMHVFTIRFNAS